MGADFAAPALAKSGGSAGVYVVAWERGGNAIEALAVDKDNRILSSRLTVASTTTAHRAPDVDGNGRDFLVVYQRAQSTNGPHDVYGSILRWDGTALRAVTSTMPIENTTSDEVMPAVGYLAGKFLVACAVTSNGFLDHNLIMNELTLGGVPVPPADLPRP